MLLAMSDIFRSEPVNALAKSKAWVELQEIVGPETIKTSVRSLTDTIQTNYRRELAEEPITQYSLNRVFLGNSGTGKTTVAKLYGQVLADLGLLSNGELVVKNHSDFSGYVISQSEQLTKDILTTWMGMILVVDEAYGVYASKASSGRRSGSFDLFRAVVIDTIVAEVQNLLSDDRRVFLLRFKDQMEEMFQNVDSNLARRLSIGSVFEFHNFAQGELAIILDTKLKK